MLDMLGKGYVIKYCKALFLKEQEERLYRSYVADMLMALVNSTGKYNVETRFIELVPDRRKKKEKEKTAGEIVADVMKKAGLTFGGS